MSDELSLMVSALIAAGRAVLSGTGSVHDKDTVVGVHDVVSDADVCAERIIIDAIRNSFPDDNIMSEEINPESLMEGRTWIVDPIDGTMNYYNGFPNYTVSIGFEDEEGPAIGVVIVARQDEMFHAMRGAGAYLNGRPIKTNEAIENNKALAILVPPHRHHELLDAYMVKMRKFYELFTDARSLGSAACSLCYVAAGRCAVYYEEYLALYDIAAGIVILKEAGGLIEINKKTDYRIDLLASSKRAFEASREIIA